MASREGEEEEEGGRKEGREAKEGQAEKNLETLTWQVRIVG